MGAWGGWGGGRGRWLLFQIQKGGWWEEEEQEEEEAEMGGRVKSGSDLF